MFLSNLREVVTLLSKVLPQVCPAAAASLEGKTGLKVFTEPTQQLFINCFCYNSNLRKKSAKVCNFANWCKHRVNEVLIVWTKSGKCHSLTHPSGAQLEGSVLRTPHKEQVPLKDLLAKSTKTSHKLFYQSLKDGPRWDGRYTYKSSLVAMIRKWWQQQSDDSDKMRTTTKMFRAFAAGVVGVQRAWNPFSAEKS